MHESTPFVMQDSSESVSIEMYTFTQSRKVACSLNMTKFLHNRHSGTPVERTCDHVLKDAEM